MQITYLFDPLCGWCYGAGPALEKLAQNDAISLRLAPTGLFAGENARTMDAGFAAYAWQNDQRIARLSGQHFSDSYRRDILGAAGTMFDSAPATLGIVAVALTQPRHEIDALGALQRARYVDGRDICDLAGVSAVLSGLGLTAAAARIQAPDQDLLNAYRQRIDDARALMAQIGAQGVPTVVVQDTSGTRVLPSSALFGDHETLAAQLCAA